MISENKVKKNKLSEKKKLRRKKFTFKIRKLWPLSKIAGRFFIIYFIIVCVGGILLSLPGFLKNQNPVVGGKEYNFRYDFLTGIFTASSAFSDTGLTISNAARDYTFLGQLVLLVLIQLGGFGVITMHVIFLILIGQKVSVKYQMLVRSERGGNHLGSTIDLIKNGFIFLIFVELVAMIFIFCVMFFDPGDATKGTIDFQTYHNFENSAWSSIFHSVSAVNNAGFDIVGQNSLVPYNHNYLLQFIFIIEFVIGGLGFPTLYDINHKIKSRLKGEHARFTLFTKLNLITYFLVMFIGLFFVWLAEYTAVSSSVIQTGVSSRQSFMNIFFNTISTRNAGFSTVDVSEFSTGSRVIQSLMMFIGSAPASTAGGIRTTTLAIVVLTIWSIIVNNNSVNVFKRKIPAEISKKALSVFAISIILLLICSIIISIENPNITYSNAIYVSSSAFGTTGLNSISFKNMYDLGISSKLFIILMMFIGQLGVSNALLIFAKGTNKKSYQYIEEDVAIG